VDAQKSNSFQIVKEQLPNDDCTLLSCPSIGQNVVQGEMVKLDIPADYVTMLSKTMLDVLEICCPSEVLLNKKHWAFYLVLRNFL
jgi:hypothetical protein